MPLNCGHPGSVDASSSALVPFRTSDAIRLTLQSSRSKAATAELGPSTDGLNILMVNGVERTLAYSHDKRTRVPGG